MGEEKLGEESGEKEKAGKGRGREESPEIHISGYTLLGCWSTQV